MLGRLLHNPAKRHADAIKPVLRYLSTRLDDGLFYKANVPLTRTCYTDTDYAADIDTSRFITGLLCILSDQPRVWISERPATVTHSSTNSEYICSDIGAKVKTWIPSLYDELQHPLTKRRPSL